MPTLNQALAAFERHVGFPLSRSRTIARRLQEADLLPLGAPGVAPLLDADGFVRLFVALAADTTHREAPAAVRKYLAMTPGGVSLDGAPLSIGRVESLLFALVETALKDPDDCRQLQIEVVGNFPELVIHSFDGTARRYQPVGALSGHWGETTHRRAITVPGVAFRDAVRATFLGATS